MEPLTKYVMMKSSSDSANDSIAAANVSRDDQRQRQCEERAGRNGAEVDRSVLERPVESAHRARTVIAMKLISNAMCAMRMVV